MRHVLRHSLLCSSILLLMGQAHALTINVTTTADEDGENSSACSLREAVRAASTKLAYGGCVAGERYIADVIQLEGKTYTLTKGALVPTREVTISGAQGTSSGQQEPFDNSYPGRIALSTVIEAQGSRIVDTEELRASFTIENLTLKNGMATGHGGAILAGGAVTLNRVDFIDNQATGAGGAIYLAGSGSTLRAKAINISGSKAGAQQPAAIGMSCFDDLQYTTRTVSIERASLVGNGSSSASAIVDFCGNPTASLTTTTLGQNTVAAADGNAVLRILNGSSNQRRLAPSASLTLTSVTVVDNQGAAIAYDDYGRLVVVNSVLAYNTAPQQCAYRGNRPIDQINNVSHSSNFLGGTPNPVFGSTVTAYATTACQLPQTIGRDTNVYQRQTSLTDALLPLGNYGGFTRGYLPNPNTNLLVDRGLGATGCGETDQRGAVRITGQRAAGDFVGSLTCDIGAMEYQQLTANSDLSSINESYQVGSTKKPPELTDAERKKLTEDDKLYLARLTAAANDQAAVYLNQFSYRRAFVDVLLNDSPQEDLTGGDPASLAVPLYRTNSSASPYTVTTESLGSAPTVDDINRLNASLTRSSDADQLKCEWVTSPSGQFDRLAVWRTDGRTTPVGFAERCKYTITYNGRSATGVVQTRIQNVAPIAMDDTFTLKYGSTSLPLELLANDNDDGDGPIDTNNDKLYDAPGLLGVPQQRVGTSIFYLDPLQADPKKQAYIKIVQKPALGKLTFEYEAGCPDNTASTEQSVCYGGKVTYTASSTYSKFNDSFKYVVYDRDAQPSNEATVTIINTATTTDNTRAGGGAMGWPLLLGLLGLALRRSTKSSGSS